MNSSNTITEIKRKSLKINRDIREINKTKGTNIRIISRIKNYKDWSKTKLLTLLRSKEKELEKFNNKFFEISSEKNLQLIEDLFQSHYKKITGNQFLVVSYKLNGSSVQRTVNAKTMSFIKEFVDKLGIVEFPSEGSDNDFAYSLAHFTPNDFTFRVFEKYKTSNTGGYFDYINTTEIDLSVLQIFNKEQYQQKLKTGIENCLVHSLRCFGVSASDLNKLKIATNHYDTLFVEKCLLSDQVAMRALEYVATSIKRFIVIKKAYTREDGVLENRMYYKGNKTHPRIDLILYKNHYMPDITLDYGKYCVKNYEEIKKERADWYNVFRKKNGKYQNITNHSKIPKITTAEVIRVLHEHPHYCQKDSILTEYINATDSSETYLDNIYNEQHDPKEVVEKEEKKPFDKIFFADCETYRNKQNEHIPFYIGAIDSKESSVNEHFFTKINDFLDFVTEGLEGPQSTVVIYFHNAKFDYSAMFTDYYKKKELVKGGQFYEAVIIHKKVNIRIRDSYKHIQMPLSSFKEVYNLDCGKKDIYMPYDLYTKRTVQNTSMRYQTLVNHTNDKENTSNIQKLNTSEKEKIIEPYCYKTKAGNKRFRHMQFMKDYLHSDVITLKEGFLKHRERILLLCKDVNVEPLDIFDILTTSSLSNKMYSAKGAFECVLELSGNLRNFVQQAVMGGRVATRRNQKYHTGRQKLGKFADFDGVSLYPSACSRLESELGGIPTGYAHGLSKGVFNRIKNNKNKYYICEIEVTNVDDKQQISFFNYKNSSGERVYDADFEKFEKEIPSRRIVIDRFTLEDYELYHNLKFVFVKGVYWEEFSPVLSQFTRELFLKRKEYKSWKNEDGQARQQAVKLMLNSIYGKTLIKPSTTKIIIKSNRQIKKKQGVLLKDKDGNQITTEVTILKEDSDGKMYTEKGIKNVRGPMQDVRDKNGELVYIYPAKSYLKKNFNIIDHFVEEKYITKFIVANNHFEDRNSAHIGCAILSLSKRIMNEVMDIANESNIAILYQDTDSMHMPENSLGLLASKFEEKYGRELIGKELGQFHNDLEDTFNFEVDGEIKTFNNVPCSSTCCVILGKKAYSDKLEIADSEENKKMFEKAGVPESVWKGACSNHIRLKGVGAKSFKANYPNIEKTIEKLYLGAEQVMFDLAKGYPKMNIINLNKVIHKPKFERKILFSYPKNENSLDPLRPGS